MGEYEVKIAKAVTDLTEHEAQASLFATVTSLKQLMDKGHIDQVREMLEAENIVDLIKMGQQVSALFGMLQKN